ncbi:MAG: glycosyl transferase family 1, partial [Chloroflexota bacterium]|nr:glycosyl transferase family 1 [Chloroflexota bacterium]
MAGPGIRYWEMARVLSARQPVILIAPHPIDLQSTSFTTGSYTWGDAASLASWLRDADVVVANGFVLMAHPEVGQLTRPLALDLYDPIPLENLELYRTAPDEQRLAQNREDTALLARQLAAGDFFLCATERQRDLYIGALMAAGRVTPTRVDRDPLLRDLIDVLPFGLPAEPPIKQHAALRGVVPGIGAADSILLWTGGLWDWLDPLTLVCAMPRVVARHPNTRLVFLAGQHPGNVPAMRAPQEAQRLASSYGLLG